MWERGGGQWVKGKTGVLFVSGHNVAHDGPARFWEYLWDSAEENCTPLTSNYWTLSSKSQLNTHTCSNRIRNTKLKTRNLLFSKKGPITEQPGSPYWFSVLNDFLSYGTFMYGAPKGTWWWEKNMRLDKKLYFNAIAISHKTSAFPGESLRSLAKRLWWKYCNIRWEEKLYFNAFTSNRRVSLGKVIVLRSHMESFEGKCKVSWGTQCFCESALKSFASKC